VVCLMHVPCRARSCGVSWYVMMKFWCRWWQLLCEVSRWCVIITGYLCVLARAGCRWRGAEREDVLVEDNVTRGDHASCGDVIAAVAAMIRRVPNEDAERGPRLELVACGGRQVGEALTAEDAELVIGWMAVRRRAPGTG